MKAQWGSRHIVILFIELNWIELNWSEYLNSALGAEWVVNVTPWPLYPWKWHGTHCIQGWVCTTAGLDLCRKSRTRWELIPGQSRPKQVAILTMLLQFSIDIWRIINSRIDKFCVTYPALCPVYGLEPVVQVCRQP